MKEEGESLSQQQLVTILNGAGQGFYLVDGKALINAEYIQTGTLAADLIKVRVDGSSNLLPVNYITMEHAINNEDFYIQKQNGIPYAECQLPMFYGGGSSEVSNTILGYSKVSLKKGKSYWFSCRYYAQWDTDTKPMDGVGTSTAGKSKYGLGTGNNLDIVLYDNADATGIHKGRNLLDHTGGTDSPHIYSGAYLSSGFQLSNSTGYGGGLGYLMMTNIDTLVENYYRFMEPNAVNLYGLEPGETYTFSGKVCGTMSSITIRHQYSSDGSTWTNMDGLEIPLKGEDYWIPFEFTFTIPSSARGYYLSLQDYNGVFGKICYAAELKLEKSNMATPWCPSPVDQGLSNPTSVEKSTPAYVLGSVKDFNASIDITDGDNEISVYGAEGMMCRTWTTLINRIDCKQDYDGYIYICLDGSGFELGSEGWFYISKLQLTDASFNGEYRDLEYLEQLREKYIELTDGSYYTNIVGVDGIKMENGNITSTFDFSGNSYELSEDGFKYATDLGHNHIFAGNSKSWYQYDGGSSGMIEGYDSMFGLGCDKQVGGNREGIFIGIHEGFQVPNSTEHGRADIYVHSKYDGTAWDDWSDWELLGQKIEPLGLVRRDDSSNITTQSCLCIADSGPGGQTWHGSVVFSEAMYNAVGNGQLINVNPSENRIYVGNPNSILMLESAYGLTVKEAGEQKQVLTNGTQYGNIQTNIYTGGNIEIWADSDCSTTTEYVWLGAGKNAITITSSGTGSSVDAAKFNGHIMINGSNLHDKIYLGGKDNTETARNSYNNGVYSYNLYNKSLLNGDGTTSAYGGYWSVLAFGNSGSGAAELAIDWTSQGRGFYMRSLRDVDDSWFKWKRIGNSDWILDSTSDERYKRAVSDVSTEDCYNMVKNIELHTYLLLTEEERYRIEKGELDADELFLRTVTSEGIHHSLQMGVLAQDMLKYSCGTYVVNQDVLRDENGELISDRYGIDAYNYASAILGGLQEEIRIRDNQYEELKKENEDLKNRLDRLEQLILKGE